MRDDVVEHVEATGVRVDADLRDVHGKAAGERLPRFVDVARLEGRLAIEEGAAGCDRARDGPHCEVAGASIAKPQLRVRDLEIVGAALQENRSVGE